MMNVHFKLNWPLRPLVLAVLLLSLTACGSLPSLNPFASGNVKPAELKPIQSNVKVNKQWQVDVGDSPSGHFVPVQYDKVVYVASAEGRLMAIEATNGKVLWSVKTDKRLKAGVGVTLDTIAVVDELNQLLAYDFTGRLKWRTSINHEVESIPVGASNSILVRGIDYSVVNFASQNGAQRWRFSRPTPPLTLRGNIGVDVHNARVYAGFPAGRLTGLDVNSGVAVWEGALATPSGTTEIERIADITGSPSYNFREVCAAAFQGRVGCLDAQTGAVVWAVPFSAPSGASVDDRFVIAPNELGDVVAFTRAGGKEVWRFTGLQRRSPTTPVVVGRAVAIGDFEGYVHWLDRDNGQSIARIQVGSAPLTGPLFVTENKSLLVQSRKGALAMLVAN